MPRSFVVRDPVHGYLQVAAHERIVVDHAITQRLRRVSQTGLADMVYPEARTSRFAHSLGAMHLASRFVVSCIENAMEADAIEFFAQLERLDLFRNFSLTSEADDLDELIFANRLEGGGLLAARVAFRYPRLRKKEARYRRLLGLAEAGVRLAALFHDLGHLPFSHDMEFALEEYVSALVQSKRRVSPGLKKLIGGPPHEVIGHSLANLVFQTLLDRKTSPAVRASFAMARKILEVPKDFYDQSRPDAGAIEWLHSLIDGEIDVDRADYLLRDARALGFEFAIYDLERLINNLVLVRHGELGFTTAIAERGFSAVETFYLSRARSNQFLVRHHKVAQAAAGFRYVATHLLESEACKSFLVVLARLGALKSYSYRTAVRLLDAFTMFDDSWWFQLLRSTNEPQDSMFMACKELVLRRQRTLASVWKRKGNLDDTQINSLNNLLKETLHELTDRREMMCGEGVLVHIHKFSPIKLRVPDDSNTSLMLLKKDNGDLRPVSAHSNHIVSLIEAWESDVHMHAFQSVDKQRSVNEIVGLILGHEKRSKQVP